MKKSKPTIKKLKKYQAGGPSEDDQSSQSGDAISHLGGIASVISAGKVLGDSIGQPIKQNTETYNSKGDLNNPNAVRNMAVVGSLFDPMKAFKTRMSYDGGMTDFSGKGYTDHLNELKHQQIESSPEYIEAQNKKNFEANMKYEFPYGGHMDVYPDGGQANAEVEKQEVMRAPDGSTQQVNGPSHAQGGVPVNIPDQTQIFSDRLKDPETKKTFAKLASVYKPDKNNKIAEDPKSTTTSIATNKLIADLKQRKLSEIFNAQESLKKSKVAEYAKKMGVDLSSLVKPQQDEREPVDNSQEETQEHAYGGVQKFPNGDTFDSKNMQRVEENDNIDVGYNPKGDGRLNTFTDLPIDQAWTKWSNQNWDPTLQSETKARDEFNKSRSSTLNPDRYFSRSENEPYSESTSMINDYRSGKNIPNTTEQNFYSNKNEDGVVSNKNKSNTNYSQIAGTVAQYTPYIADLAFTKFGKKYDKENYGQMSPKSIDYTQSLRDADAQSRVAAGDLASSTGGNAGSYLANRAGLSANIARAKANIRQSGDAKNVEIYNQFLPLNKELQTRATIDTEQNKARSEDIARQAGRGLSGAAAGTTRDISAGQMDKYSLDLISKAFPDYQYDSNKRAWFHKQTGQKLDVNNLPR